MTYTPFRRILSCLLVSTSCLGWGAGLASAGGPAWNAPSAPPWERKSYQGYKEAAPVVQQAIPRREQPHEQPEKYTIVITPVLGGHKLDDANTVHIVAHVPENAHVWIEGEPTTQTGTMRSFVSPPLEPNKRYNYAIRVDWREGDKIVSETKKILVHAGELHCLDVVQAGSDTHNETVIGVGLTWLKPEDHKIAIAQKLCPVTNLPLGKKGMIPVKIIIKGEPVFLCCEPCTAKAEAKPDETLAKVKELKAKNAPKEK